MYLIMYFVIRFKYAFNPFNALTVHSDALTKLWTVTQNQSNLPKNGENSESEYSYDKNINNTKWATQLQFVLIENKICYFLISKLQKFKRSNIPQNHKHTSRIALVIVI